MFVHLCLFPLLLRLTTAINDRVTQRRVQTRSPEGQDSHVKVIVPLTQSYNVFCGEITVGTPAEGGQEQVFTVTFDTGSDNFWLASADLCPGRNCTANTFKPFDESRSASYRRLPGRFSTDYSDGTTVEGGVAQDTFKIGTGENAVVVKSQVFGIADTITDTRALEYADGVFGLGLGTFPSLPGQVDTPFWSIVRQVNMLPVFGFYLTRHSKGPDAGTLVFGGHDEDLVDGEFSFHDVVKVEGQYFGWLIKFDKISVGRVDQPYFLVTPVDMLALPDSGSCVIAGPAEVFDTLNLLIFHHAKFNYTAEYFFSCDAPWANLPVVTFTMDGQDFQLTPEDYIRTLEDGSCRTRFLSMPNTYAIVLGTIFLEKFYTRFNLGEQRVEFAKAKHKTYE